MKKTFLLFNSHSIFSAASLFFRKFLHGPLHSFLTHYIHEDSFRWDLIQADIDRRSWLIYVTQQSKPGVVLGISICSGIFIPWPFPRVLSFTPDWLQAFGPAFRIHPKLSCFSLLNYTAPCSLSLHSSPQLLHYPPHWTYWLHIWVSCPIARWILLNPIDSVSPIIFHLSSTLNRPLVPTLFNTKAKVFTMLL